MVGARDIVHEKFTAPRRVPVQSVSSFTIVELFAISKIIISSLTRVFQMKCIRLSKARFMFLCCEVID